MRSKNPKLMQEIKYFAENYYREHSKTPSNGTIADALGMGRSTVYYYLVEMAKRGMITYENGMISTENIRKLTPEVTHAALVGSIPCGEPDERLNTLKRLCYDDEKDCYYLHPENSDFEDIYVNELRVQGVARHIIKAL